MVRSTPRSRRRTPTVLEDPTKGDPFASVASLLIRSLLVLFLLITSLVLALIAWFSLKSFLRVDPIIGRERVWLQYGEFRTPYGFVDLPKGRYGAPGQSYDLSLELVVPTSPQNFEIGNFMVSIGLLNEDLEPIVNNSRPAILLRHAPHSSSSSSFPRLLPLLRPSQPPTRSISVPLMEGVAMNRNGATSWGAKSNKVEKVYIEVGRKDAHPELAASSSQLSSYPGGGGGSPVMTTRLGGELQVYESWLKIQVKLYGLRALIRSHPYLSFLFFFPTFLLTELLAALAVYAYFVFRPDHHHHSLPRDRPSSSSSRRGGEGIGKEEEEEEEEEEEGESDAIGKELEREIKSESTAPKEEEEEEEQEGDLTTSEPPSVVTETEEEEEEEEEEKWESERRRERREREAGPGGIGMSEIAGETETETETEPGISEEEEEEEGGGSEEWAAIEGETRDKDSDDDNATLGGSETTRATRSTFGPSVTGTTSTATSSSRRSEGLRERQGQLGAEDAE